MKTTLKNKNNNNKKKKKKKKNRKEKGEYFFEYANICRLFWGTAGIPDIILGMADIPYIFGG